MFDISQIETSQPFKPLILFIIGSHGCMFDVVAGANPIIISSLDIHVQKRSRIGDTSSLVKVIVYTKKKSYRGYEGDKEVWQVRPILIF